MPLIQPHEAIALAAVLQTMRSEGSLQARKPSWEQPTFFSKPLLITAMPVLPPAVGPLFPFTTVLSWRGPVQYVSVITGYTFSLVANPALVNVQFQVTINGALLPGLNFTPGVDLFKGGQYPLTQRKTMITVNENSVLAISAKNLTSVPQTLLLSLTGWSYPTLDAERSAAGQGVTDA